MLLWVKLCLPHIRISIIEAMIAHYLPESPGNLAQTDLRFVHP